MFHRYSDNTIAALEMLDGDDKIDLELILALIRHIVHNEEVSLTLNVWLQARNVVPGKKTTFVLRAENWI